MADIEIIDSLIKDIDNIGNFAEEQTNILNNLYKQLLDSVGGDLPEANKEDSLLSEILEKSEINEEDTLLSNKDGDINLLSEINKEDNLLSEEEFDEDDDESIDSYD